MTRFHMVVPPTGSDDPHLRTWMEQISQIVSEMPPIMSGTTGPESTTTADIGTIYIQNDYSATSVAWVKQTGEGNTGWVAIG